MTKQQVQKLTTAERIKLLKLLIESFDSVTVTGLYGSEANVTPQHILRGEPWGKKNDNAITISTDICSG